MSYLDPPDDSDRSRHRARHADVAAPESYHAPGPYHEPYQQPRFARPPAAVPHGGSQHDGARTGGNDRGQPGGARQEPAKSSRAGRNLPAAIGVGATLGGVVVASLLLWRPAFLAVVAAAAAVGVWEMVRAIARSTPAGGRTLAGAGSASVAGVGDPESTGAVATRARPPLVPLLVACPLMIGLAWVGGVEAMILGLALTVVAAMVWRLADGPAGYRRDVGSAALVAVYVPFLAGFAALLVHPADGSDRVLLTLASVVLSDTGGYVAGVFFGRHPMAPTVSPKKSWEGLAGSLVATAAGGSVLIALMFHQPWWHGAIFGFSVSVAAVLGDLSESLLKRDLGVKDMSNLLPGHGGLMDRLDSILFAAPTAYLLFSLLAPPAG
jgi:phosphatidate cytidylyltransferase